MIKKLISVGVGLSMLATPLVALAQTTTGSSDASLFAMLTQLIQVLEQELQQLIAAHNAVPSQPTMPTSGLSASPVSGAAPLAVTFTTSGSQFESASIDFGDGVSKQMNTLFGNGTNDSAGYCGAGPDFFCSVPHTYLSAGTYTATIKNSLGTVLGSATITVQSQPSLNFSAHPTSGSAPLSVEFDYNPSAASRKTINFGDGQSTQLPTGCSSGGYVAPSCGLSHTYNTYGTYYVYVIASGACTNVPQGGTCDPASYGSATITVTGSASTPSPDFTASPLSGSAPLQVSFRMSGSDLGFTSFDFGNGQTFVTGIGSNVGNINCTAQAQDTVCFADQTYTAPGTYTATLHGSNGAALGSVTINVIGNGFQPSAAIDGSSLTTTSSTPTITGTLSGTNAICVTVRNTNQGPLPQTNSVTGPSWTGCSASGAITISSNGHWAMPTYGYTGNTFANGTYNVGVYDANRGNLLDTAVLTVQ